MPIIYLSPSTQESNLYVNGGSEEEWMNRLADAMVPYLDATGIRYSRNTPDMTAASSIRASNAGNYDLHLALHSNASPPGQEGQNRGVLVFHYPGSVQGTKAANIMADQLKEIYPLPQLVRAEPTASIGEVRLTRAPSVFLELGYHDNLDDAVWVQTNLDLIAQTIVRALAEYFQIPFLTPNEPRQGVVDVNWGYLNIRSRPSLSAPVIAKAYDGATLTILNQWQDWYLVSFDGTEGYASADFITLV